MSAEDRFAPGRTACLALADGQVFWGRGFGAEGRTVGELCFNTAMTGYQEIMTDPSYAEQIVAFTFPHIGNTGATPEDNETGNPVALGMVTRMDPTAPSNWRAVESLDAWMKRAGRSGIGGVDTRRLTRRVRDLGMPHAALEYRADGNVDADALVELARGWNGLEGADLAGRVTCSESYSWKEKRWVWGEGHTEQTEFRHRVVAIDYGAKRNILRSLADVGCDVTVVPAQTSAAEIMALQPDGVFLTNGPGDPAATGEYAVPVIRELIDSGKPVFGVCLGHQMLALALGGRTKKMKTGHHGANHPVKNVERDTVEITSMNHGFTVDADTLPEGVRQTHVSLFDGTNCGLSVDGRPIFSVQYHPEASPGPKDSFYLFEKFAASMEKQARNTGQPVCVATKASRLACAYRNLPHTIDANPALCPFETSKGIQCPTTIHRGPSRLSKTSRHISTSPTPIRRHRLATGAIWRPAGHLRHRTIWRRFAMR